MRPFIYSVKPGSMAHRCDSLVVGDVLLEVNGISVSNLKHDDILTLLKNSGETVTLLVEYSIDTLSKTRCFCRNHVTRAKGIYFSDVSSPEKYVNKCIEVALQKEDGKTGITFRGGSYGPDAKKCRPIMVVKVRTGSPADRDGRIRVRDRILAVNDFSVENASHGTVVDLLNDCTSTVTLTVQYSVAIHDQIRNAHGPVVFEMDHLPGSDVGLRLEMVEYTAGKRSIRINNVAPGSTADRCGALQVGDELLSVNGISLRHTMLPEVYEILRGRNRTKLRLEIIPLGCLRSP
ncbi:unnamed protein product, partial [Soboliphyme baturini]|uniref:PDZ domain-containing protein n=1 Tax=Soboliphyme baturini TaxID=241478 RepID=A0A183IA17_9BILA